MKKLALAKRLSKQNRVSQAEAADHLDRVIHQIVSTLRKGQAAPLPGLGKFTPGEKWSFRFESEKRKQNGRGGRK